MKGFLLLLICFILLIFIPKEIFAHSQIQVIEITAGGFQPDPVTLDQNSTIIFVNKDSQPHWPASNVHPTHELYPEFDPKQPIEPGKSWAFKPRKLGTWKYHDHLYPHIRGTINVAAEVGRQVQGITSPNNTLMDKIKSFWEGILAKIKSIFPSFSKKKVLGVSNFINLPAPEQIKAIEEMAKMDGVEKTWQYIKDTFKGQAGSSGNIHDLAHLAGKLIYTEKGFSGMTICTPIFAFGCFHGFLDQAFQKDLSHLLDAQNACLKLGPQESGPVASCIHGIGHGVASFYSVRDLDQSLSSCRSLSLGSQYCFDGVFMEFARSAPQDFYKRADPLYPCDDLENRFGAIYSFSCGRNQPTILLSRLKLTFSEVVNLCLTSSSDPFKQACFDSLGFMVAATGDVGQIITSCKQIEVADFVFKCTKAAAGELVFQEIPGWSEKSKQVCNSLDANGQSECQAYVNTIINQYNRHPEISFNNLKDGQDPNLYIRAELRKCYETAGKDDCYKKLAQVFFNQFGLRKSLDLLAQNENYPEVYARCHEVTHYLSRLEYDQQQNIAKVYAQCDSTCHGGCYHGTLEAYLKQKTEQNNFDLFGQFPKICGEKNNYQKPIEFNECLHGLGHAAMFISDMELKQSLKLCNSLSEQDFKDRCYSGVFMENSSSSTSSDHASIYLKTDDPFYPCNVLEEKYLPVCWQYQSSYFSILNHQNWLKVADLCLQIPNQYQDRCFRTIGTNQVGFTSSYTTMRDDCNLMPSDHFKDICVSGVVSSLAYRFVEDPNKMVEFCSIVNDQYKEGCFKQMGMGFLDWSANKDLARQNCQKIPDSQGLSWCLSVI